MSDKKCPIMSRPKLSRFPGQTPSTDGSYDEFVFCQKECMAWIDDERKSGCSLIGIYKAKEEK